MCSITINNLVTSRKISLTKYALFGNRFLNSKTLIKFSIELKIRETRLTSKIRFNLKKSFRLRMFQIKYVSNKIT